MNSLADVPSHNFGRSVSTNSIDDVSMMLASAVRATNTLDDTILADSRHCARMNRIGTMQLQENQFQHAIDSFGSALSLLNKVLSTSGFVERATRYEEEEQQEVFENDQEEEENLDDEHDVMLDDDDDASSSQDRRVARPVSSSCGDAEDTFYPEDDATTEEGRAGTYSSEELLRHQDQLHKTPIRVPADFYPTYEVLVNMAISIMFNFALSHHLAATTPGLVEDPSKMMDQAVALYELTHTLQLQEGIELSIEHTMATICNLGHIHRIRGNTDKATKCFQHLLAVIVFLQSENQHLLHHQEDYARNDDADDEQYVDNEVSSLPSVRNVLNTENIFFQSVSHLMLRDSDTAAAA